VYERLGPPWLRAEGQLYKSRTSFALALLLAIGTTAICVAKTFVYVSNAQDGNIDAYTMDTSTGSLTPVGSNSKLKTRLDLAGKPARSIYALGATLAAGFVAAGGYAWHSGLASRMLNVPAAEDS
jgi:hypothetical protein